MTDTVFYKYRKLDTNSLKQLSGNYIWMSDPTKFNDPYDTHVRYEFSGSTENWVRYLDKVANEFPAEDMEKLYSAAKENPSLLENLFNGNHAISQHSAENAKSQFLVCSFSRRWDSLLLWSHYADEHRGICIGYRSISSDSWDLLEVFDERLRDVIEIKGRHFVPLVGVKYTKDLSTTVNLVSDGGGTETLRESLRTKYWDWRYEKEYRLIKFRDGVQDVRMRLGVIKEVLLGVRMSNSDEEFMVAFVENLNEQWELGIRVYKLVLDQKQFKMRKVRKV